MPTSIPGPKEDVKFRVKIIGYKKAETMRRLVKACASIPCLPSIIFRLDKPGRLLGAVDQIHEGRIFYIQVEHWGRAGGALPQLSWALDPNLLGSRLERKAQAILLEDCTSIRSKTLTVLGSTKELGEISAEAMQERDRLRHNNLL